MTQNADAAKAAIATAEAQVNVAQVNVDKLIPLVQKGIISNTSIASISGKLANIKSVDNKKYQKLIRLANKLKIDIKKIMLALQLFMKIVHIRCGM